MSQTLEEEVNKPIHYNNHKSGIEAIEITRWLGFDLGNAWKYLMRYLSKKYDTKSTQKKDLMKVNWYMTDFLTNFIDPMTSESTYNFDLPEHVGMMMWLVYETEENSAVKDVFKEIIDIVTGGGLINPARTKEKMDALRAYADSFNE